MLLPVGIFVFLPPSLSHPTSFAGVYPSTIVLDPTHVDGRLEISQLFLGNGVGLELLFGTALRGRAGLQAEDMKGADAAEGVDVAAAIVLDCR